MILNTDQNYTSTYSKNRLVLSQTSKMTKDISPVYPITTMLLDMVSNNTFKVSLTEEDFNNGYLEHYDVQDNEFVDAEEDLIQRLKFKLKTGVCSSVLIDQLVKHKLGLFEKFGGEFHHYHFQTILDTIQRLEENHPMEIRPFNGNILKGLKHIHHHSDIFILNNISNFLNAKKAIKEKNEKELQTELVTIYTELVKIYPERIAQLKSATTLLHNIHNKVAFRPFEKRTGEWIVFATINDKNYYLCLATHKEGDQNVFNRIKPCFDEFLELENYKN